MHAPRRQWRGYLRVLIAAALALCFASTVAYASVTTNGFPFGNLTPLADEPVATITVAFDSNGGSAVDTQVVAFGSLVAAPLPDPTRTGSVFAGWYSDAGLTTPWDFSADTVGSDMTLYAKWAINSYQVAFDSNGGSAVDSQVVAFGSLVATPVPDPTRAGYAFAGWYSNPGLTTPWDFSADTIGAADMTLYAKWAINSYQVAFDSNGGSAVDSQVVAFGSLVATPVPDPTRAGYAFAGWYSNPGLTTPWDFSADTIGAADMTLYAKWAINSYQVAFNSNGGSAVSAQVVAFGSLVATPLPDPTRVGYAFAGWYSDPGLTTIWHFSADTIGAADMTLYAKWVINGYQVSFDSNGGSAVSAQVVAFGSHVATPVPEPSRVGYAFDGWFADHGLTSPWDFSADTVPAFNVTLFAKWVRVYQVTGSIGAHGSLSIGNSVGVREGSSLTVAIIPDAGYGVASVMVDGVSRGTVTAFTFENVTGNHSISATFKRITSTSLSASAKTIRRGHYVKLYTRLLSSTNSFSNTYIRFEVRLPGSSKYILLKKVKLSSTGRAKYRYKVLNKGKRYHRVRFVGNATLLPAPLKLGSALRVR